MKKHRRRENETTRLPEVRGEGKAMKHLPVVIILIAASILILMNLGNIYLWQDEAQTACIAKTILTHGVPLGYDGKNYFSQQFGAEAGSNRIWTWHPWLPFYLLAAFYAVFGVSTFVSRLPFALLGIGIVIVTYYFGRSLWGTKRAGVLAAVLLLASVPFLLLMRQCRYYSPAAFLSLAGLYAYSEMLKERKHAPTAFAVAAFLLFHTLYVYCAALLLAVGVHSLIFRRDKLRLVLALSGIVIALNIAWIPYLSGLRGVVGKYAGFSARSMLIGWTFLWMTRLYIFPPWLILAAVGVGALHWIRKKRPPALNPEAVQSVALLLLFVAANIVILTPTSPNAFFRYLAPIIPVFCLIIALIAESCMRIHWSIGIVVLGAVALTTWTPDYLYEITHDYDGPIEGIANYLNANGSDSDVVYCTHEDLPLKFYTKMKVLGTMTGEDLSGAVNADWIVIRRFSVEQHQLANIERLNKKIPWWRYQQIALPCPDIEFENRESPFEHRFRTVTDAPPVLIFKKIAE